MSRGAKPTQVSGKTTVVGIFGDPVAQSRSPKMHHAAFAALNLDYAYVPFHVVPGALAAATRAIRALGMRGVNLTVPHKEKVLRYLDSTSDLASKLGAANTVIHRDGHLHGDNTDVYGFVESLRSQRRRLRKGRAIVVGAGGAARAALFGLGELGVREVLLVNRTQARGRRTVKDLAGSIPATEVAPLSALSDTSSFDGVALVVNATSLGWGKERFPRIEIDASHASCMYYDMAYGRQTDFLRQAQKGNRPHMDGAEMLILQGARSFTLWTKRRAPVAAMRIALHTKY